MVPEPLLFCFDYVDPLSWLVEGELDALARAGELPPLRRLPLELRVPPAPLLDPDEEAWMDRWNRGLAAAAGPKVLPAMPGLVPWTRKAHEFVLHAEAKGAGERAHGRVFDAVFREGRDVGRVDVLVEVGRPLGMDSTETKAVLDVDRYTQEVARLRTEAQERGALEPPTLILGSHILQGFHNRDALRTFLLR